MLVNYVNWLRFRGLSEKTVKRRLVTLSRFVLAHPDLGVVRPVDIETWLGGLGVQARSRGAYLSDLRSFFKWAVTRGYVGANPAADVESPKVPTLLPRPAPPADLEVAVQFAKDVRVRRSIMLGWYAGLRCCEIADLHTSNVTIQYMEINDESVLTGTIFVRKAKGGKQRVVPLHPRLAGELTGVEGMVVGAAADTISGLVSAHFASLGMPWTAHNTRHTFATLTYRACRDLLLVRDLLGHSSVGTTQVYAAADPTQASEVVRKIA